MNREGFDVAAVAHAPFTVASGARERDWRIDQYGRALGAWRAWDADHHQPSGRNCVQNASATRLEHEEKGG